jgi:glutamate dehydrogenase
MAKKSSPAALAKMLGDRFCASLLPGEAPGFGPEQCAEAAAFAMQSLAQRDNGEPGLVVDSVTSPTSGQRYLRMALVNDDMPFLVDSIAATVAAHGLVVDRLVHPVIPVSRSADGALLAIDPDQPTARESVIYLETERADARVRRDLAAALKVTLADVRAAVTDWPRLRAAMLADAEAVTDPEGAELLRWLADDNFTQLGHLVHKRDGSQQGLLGVCRKSARALLAPASWERAFTWFETSRRRGTESRPVPLVIKANRLSNVHRRVPLDLFIVPMMEDGKVAALSIHAGIWTSAALAASPTEIPRLRSQLAHLMEKLGFAPNGHAGKALVHALTALPHDLLVGFGESDLERIATAMIGLVDRPRPRLALVRAPLARHLFAFVWLPRDALSTSTRLAIQALLERATKAPAMDWALSVEGNNLALIRFVLDIRDGDAAPDEAVLDGELQAMLRGWRAAVESELASDGDASRAAALAMRFAEAFPQAYRATYGAAGAAADIRTLRTLTGEGGPRRAARLHRLPGEKGLRLKLYQREGAIVLSDAVPVLENFGFRVLEENPTPLEGGKLGYIHDFLVAPPADCSADDLLARAGMIEASLGAVLNGAAEDDAFNRLIVATGLAAQEADWLRAWYRYLRQAGMGYGISTVVDALKAAPLVTRALIDGFVARHDPAFSGDREKAAGAAAEAIRDALTRVAAINDDRLLRAFRALGDAILRTNAFAPAGREALAFKLDSALVPGLPRPVPWREIFVYSRRVEGIHLRAGPVARGGLRWSDRRDDFRTEILGLMKAQRVKNAVIVPTGAKGGFYPKQLPDPARDREGWLAEGKASYQVFIRTLLSVTDNIVGGKVVHPDGVVIHDGEDPYFVVAADKGTATFSDVANAIAEEHGFWLDDAFASGGSNGYDHKAMGITAKGAWLSVQRHFLEMGVDVQADPVRVAGCGDMSGDVFGNGMLLSKSLKIVAAFDHRHVFLDPDPDPAKSWAERARMFALPRSSWDDYDKALISNGGGVFPRSMKAIPLSPEVRAMLDLDVAEIDPEGLIHAILKARVDLLWFGGIGTYIKGSGENNAVVGDPANDALRVDGREVRAQVIGEGANLGTTQAGRIEFALHGAEGLGGRINTDFIDNSAGVDCSDNEVNIKIALAGAKRAGRLTEKARVSLLASMTDEVAALVLEDNRLQALALSIAQRPGPLATASHARLIDMLEEGGDLDRRTEGLADSDTLKRRAADGMGLTRPELAVVLSSAKLVLQREIEASALPDDPALEADLIAAFPAKMQDKFRKDILAHRLRREIIATKLANRMINRLGTIHPFELMEEEGATLAEVTAAFVAAERLFGMADAWRAIDAAAMPEAARLTLFERAASALRGHMADILRAGHHTLVPGKLVGELGKGVAALSAETGSLLNAEARAQGGRLAGELAAVGAPAEVAGRIGHLFDMDGAVGLARLAADTRTDPVALTRAFADLGARLGLDWAQQAATAMNPSDPWERLLVAGLARDFQQMRLDFLKGAKKAAPGAFVESWLAAREPSVRQFRALVGRARAAQPVAPAMLAQVASQARNLLGR